MSCRATKANSACTSLAQAVSELDDAEIQARFHALKREGKDEHAPTPEEFQDFLRKQYNLVKDFDELDMVRRRSIEERLNAAHRDARYNNEEVPDGPTFYALKNITADAGIAGERKRATDLATRLPTMTPADIDTELAAQYDAYYKTEDRLLAAKRDVDYTQRNVSDSARRNDGVAAPNRVEDLDKAKKVVASYEAKNAKFRRRLDPYEQEYTRRGRWSRYHLVIGTGQGHLHTSMRCNTTYDTTRYTWNPELSGKDESEAIAEFGEKCCTVCMPTAPANPNFSGPGRRDRETQDVRRAEREARAAAKAAKAITRPDGTVLRDASGSSINSLVTAQREYVGIQAYNAWLTRERGHVMASTVEKNKRILDDIEQAIAHKTGKTVEEVRTEAAPKVAKKVAKGEW